MIIGPLWLSPINISQWALALFLDPPLFGANWTLQDISPFLGRPTGLSSWCGSWSRAGRRVSWPSPSRGEVDQAPRVLPAPRRSSAASGGAAATPGSPETNPQLFLPSSHSICKYMFGRKQKVSNHVMVVCQKLRLINYAKNIGIYASAS